MEAAVVNSFSPGDAVLSVTCGAFGNRLAKIATTFGLNVTRHEVEWGRAADTEAVAEALAAIPNLRGVLLTQNETSTGVTNDIEALARVVRAQHPDALLLVAAVSSLGCIDLLMDETEMARRRAQAPTPPPAPRRGYARLHAEHVLGADEGCDFDFMRPG